MGAWIEITRFHANIKGKEVAPFMGAWIEISPCTRRTPWTGSHPLWVRGLKYMKSSESTQTRVCRTLYGCVDWNSWWLVRWAETVGRTLYGCVDWNAVIVFVAIHPPWSHPLWVRGLKWLHIPMRFAKKSSHPLWVRGLKYINITSFKKCVSSTLYGCVDWNGFWEVAVNAYKCRTLYGCVDWNRNYELIEQSILVAPFMGAWIEI